MKRLFFILAVFTLFSCQVPQSEKTKQIQELANNTDVYDLKIVVIDGCEYLQYHTYHYDAITHKGNCKNHKQ
jgi:hypothetical protein